MFSTRNAVASPPPHPRSTPFELEVRNQTRFDFSTVESAIHTADNRYISHFYNALSLLTPITEGILIRAVRKAQPLLEGSELDRDARAFIGQEAVHTREHRRFNRRLGELGFDVEPVIAAIEREVEALEARMTLPERLALVVAGEHAIYAVARSILTTPEPGEQHDEVRKLFVWHALEEMEHQSVCDDIYRHVCGAGARHRLRYYRAFLTAAKLLVRMTRTLMKELLSRSRPARRGERRAFVRWLLWQPGIGVGSLKETAGFFSPRFAHWRRQEQDRALIDAHLEAVYSSPNSAIQPS